MCALTLVSPPSTCFSKSHTNSLGTQDNGPVQAARDAVANPVNPRAHTGPDGRASLSSRVHEQASDAGDHEVGRHTTFLYAYVLINLYFSVSIMPLACSHI